MPQHELLKHSEKEIRLIFEINTLAHYWTLQAFLPKMLEKNEGHIVALSSIAGVIGLNNLVPYCGSKFAVRGHMESLSEELRAHSKGQSKVRKKHFQSTDKLFTISFLSRSSSPPSAPTWSIPVFVKGWKFDSKTFYDYWSRRTLRQQSFQPNGKELLNLQSHVSRKRSENVLQAIINRVFISGYMYYLNCFLRLFPIRASLLVRDFFDSGVESDL